RGRVDQRRGPGTVVPFATERAGKAVAGRIVECEEEAVDAKGRRAAGWHRQKLGQRCVEPAQGSLPPGCTSTVSSSGRPAASYRQRRPCLSLLAIFQAHVATSRARS